MPCTGACNGDRNSIFSQEERLRLLNVSDKVGQCVPVFYFLGSGDMLHCFRCNGTLGNWTSEDSPTGEYCHHFPACKFVLRREASYVPLVGASTDSVDGQLLSHLPRLATDEQVTMGQAAYPEMEHEDTRLTTFSTWPTSSSIRPDTLAHAGFFYTGVFCLFIFVCILLTLVISPVNNT